jgi:signal transduction histidine kinase
MDKTKITDEILIQELQDRLQEYKKTMHDLSELNRELTDVNKKLTESEALKTHFISNIANEIMNPFASIIGLTRTIMQISEGDWKKVKNMTKLIHSEAFNLDFQLKNIFAAAELEAGEVYPEISKVDIKQVISGMIELFEPEIQKKQLEVEFICTPSETSGDTIFFKTDSEKMRVIVANLLSNAIKFSNEKGKIELKAWIEDTVLNLSVRDYGIGISDENQRIIFDRFKRVDTGINSLNRGHGLGLSINKAYLDMLDGTINLQSKENQGAYFIITVPIPKGEAEGYSTNGNEIIFSDDELF